MKNAVNIKDYALVKGPQAMAADSLAAYGELVAGSYMHSLILRDLADEPEAWAALRDRIIDHVAEKRRKMITKGNPKHAEYDLAIIDLWLGVVYGEPFVSAAKGVL